MFNRKLKRAICIMSSTAMLGVTILPTLGVSAAEPKNVKGEGEYATKYAERFLDLYRTVKDPSTGYFNNEGVPYHSIETLMVEAPDQGHESTSEAASYLGWLEAMNGEFTGDFSGLEDAWDVIEEYFIPTDQDQPGQTDYNTSKPATYADEYNDPGLYPSELKTGKPVGSDPLYNELKNTYNTTKIYGMHWLIDVDNFYGYGRRGSGNGTAYINTYQRGREESCFETVPQPSWEDFSWGKKGEGYLSLFTGDASYSKQWRYTNAPDADARLIQAMWSARNWAKDNGKNISGVVKKASKMGDYLRYAMFDKYFEKIGGNGTVAGTGRDSQHYLMSWYYAWGGAIDANWCWRIGCSHSHFGYQDPMTAYILSTDSDFIPQSPTAKQDWEKSLKRQIELYKWLQSDEGAIAGGCTNSWNGAYEKIPADVSTFYGMGYTAHPVYNDPGSNRWIGMQGWSMQRMCEYYLESGDESVKDLVTKWAKWIISKIKLNNDGTFSIPSNLGWTGQPDTWTGTYTGNKNLHCTVDSEGEDVGIAGSLANALLYYAKATGDKAGFDTAQGLLDRLWESDRYHDEKGIAVDAPWDSAKRFFEQEVYVPSSYQGVMPSGDKIQSGVTFIGLRSQYKQDKDYNRLLAAYKAGEDPIFRYHRFWAQVEVAVANGVMANLFPDGWVDSQEETVTVNVTSPANGAIYDMTDGVASIRIRANASTSLDNEDIDSIEYFVDGESIGVVNGSANSIRFIPEDETKDYEIYAVATSTTGKTQKSKTIVITVEVDEDEPTVEPTKIVEPTKDVEPSIDPTVDPTVEPTVEPTKIVEPTKDVEPTKEVGSDVKVTFNPQGAANSNTMGGSFVLTSPNKAVNLKDIELRYYFTEDSDINVFVDNADMNLNVNPYYVSLTSSVTTKVVNGAKKYISVTFNKDQVLEGSAKVNLQLRAAKNDWSNFNQADDESYVNGPVVVMK